MNKVTTTLVATVAAGAAIAVAAPAVAQAGSVVGPAPAAATSAALRPLATTAPAVDNSTRAGALAAYRTVLQPARAVANTWNGSTSTCNAGAPTAAVQDAAVKTVNYYRRMVGLAPVALDPAWSKQAQTAALTMLANNRLDHAPAPSWRCWTPVAAATAGRSNLASGVTTGANAMDMYIDDIGNEGRLGHRRWLFDPRITRVGNGQTSSTNALKLWENGLPATNPAGAPAAVAWPDAGYVPKTLVRSGMQWSYSVTDPAVSTAYATVTVTSNGVRVPVKQAAALVNGYGQPAVGFTPDIAGTGTADRSFVVTISGLRKGSTVLPSRSYTTTLFDPNYATTALAAAAKPLVNTVTWNPTTSVRVGSSVPRNPVAASGSRTFTFGMSSTPGVCSFGAGTITFGARGTCRVTVTTPAANGYPAGSVTRVFTVL